MKGYYVNQDGYITGYGEAIRGVTNFVESEELEILQGKCLRANVERTKIESIEIPVGKIEIPAKMEIENLKRQLATMDYKTSKYLDGEYSGDEWNLIAQERMEIRARIRELEKTL